MGKSLKTEPAEIFLKLRNMVLSTIAAPTSAPAGVWAVVMEMGYPQGSATLVSIADGTVSVYFSGGGGVIGLGEHASPREASKSLLALAPNFLKFCQETHSYPLPKPNCTRFYLRTNEKTVTDEAKTDDLGNNRHSLSPLFHKAHELLTAVRLVDEELRKKKSGAPSA